MPVGSMVRMENAKRQTAEYIRDFAEELATAFAGTA